MNILDVLHGVNADDLSAITSFFDGEWVVARLRKDLEKDGQLLKSSGGNNYVPLGLLDCDCCMGGIPGCRFINFSSKFGLAFVLYITPAATNSLHSLHQFLCA